jgi:tetratricopeptide (TPR) repeat protein
MRRLEGYRVPKRLVGLPSPVGPVPRRLAPVFRDREELASASDLSARIVDALEDSASLIVLASPAAARSRWVNEEIRAFIRSGRGDRIFAFVVDGDPAAVVGDEACFPEALRFRSGPDGELTGELLEPIAADARPEGDGRQRALGKLIAGMIGVGYDDLRQREVQRRNQRLIAITAASILGMAVTVGLALAAYLAREDAERRRTQAENLLGFMVGDLRDSLEPLGRLDLLDKVGDEAMAYFSSVEPGDLTDDGLSRQAQALTQIGEVRLSQARYDEALASFSRAYERSVELVQRQPGAGGRLFDRGQAEFWIGYVAWQRRDIERAREWFTRYLDTSAGLVAMDPDSEEWLLELTYAQHNLAVLELNHGDLDRAASVFRDQVRIYAELDCDEPRCDGIKEDLADAVGWQALTALKQGQLEAALGHFLESRTWHADLLGAAPDNRSLRYEYADEVLNAGRAAYWLGRTGQARALLEEGAGVASDLVAHDPENLKWRSLSAGALLTLARIDSTQGRNAEAEAKAEAALADFRTIFQSEAPALNDKANFARAHHVRGRLRLQAGDARGAERDAETALGLLQGLREPWRTERRIDIEETLALMVLGDALAAQGHRDKAREAWRSARRLAEARLGDTLDPRVAEAYVRASARKTDRADAHLAALRATGLAIPGLWPEG